MRRLFAIPLLLAGALALGQVQRSTPPARTPAVAAPPRFETFSVLVKRNIFDPNRRPAAVGAAYTPPPAPVNDRIALGGVLLDNGEAVAFFEGSSPEFNASIRLGGVIAGFRLTAIQTDRVQLARSDRKLTLPVAAQLARRPKGDWEITTDTTPIAGASGPVIAAGPSMGGLAGGPGTPAASGPQSDILKKLMERRRKELGQ